MKPPIELSDDDKLWLREAQIDIQDGQEKIEDGEAGLLDFAEMIIVRACKDNGWNYIHCYPGGRAEFRDAQGTIVGEDILKWLYQDICSSHVRLPQYDYINGKWGMPQAWKDAEAARKATEPKPAL